MPPGIEPTEEYDGSITVRLLDDPNERRDVSCSGFPEAAELVREYQYDVTAVKIIDRDDEVVFDSVAMDIDAWETEWEHAKRRLSGETEKRECPYDSVACFADDLCVRCQIDELTVG